MSVTETTQKVPRYDGGTFDVTFASSGARSPGLVVISSVYGVTPDLRGMMRRFAASGFVVAAPEMFTRIGPGPLGQSEEERTQARGRLVDFDYASGMEDVKATMAALRARPDCNGTVAVLGYCFGGEFAYRAAIELGAAAAIAYHGVGIGKHLEHAGKINVPLSLHFGGEDRFVPDEEIDAIKAAHATQPDVEVYVYPGGKHGFAQSDSAAYDAAMCQLAEERTLTMLARIA